MHSTHIEFASVRNPLTHLSCTTCFLGRDVESRDDKSSSTSGSSFRSRSTATVRCLRRLFCFLLSRKGRDLSLGTRSTFTERTLRERTRIASVLRVASVFPQLDISSAVVLLTRRSATSVTERVSRDRTAKRGRNGDDGRRYALALFTASLIGIPF